MSNRRKLSRPKIRPVPMTAPHVPTTEWTAMQFGAVADKDDEEQVTEVRQTTHDRVIDLTGIARRSGVRWYDVPASDLDACREWINKAEIEQQGAEAKQNGDGLIAFLEANPDGLLIVAAVDCVRHQDRSKIGLS